MVALDRHVEFVLLRDGMVVVGISLLEIERAFLHLEHPDVGLVAGAVVVVFLVAGFRTFPAADADAEVERVGELDVILGRNVLDVDFDAVALACFGFETFEDSGEFLASEFFVVLLKEL